MELAAVADISGAALDTCREMYGIPHCFEDYRELLAMDSIDAVTVGTPNSAHYEPTIDALRAGKDVLVRNPWPSRRKKPRNGKGEPGHGPHPW